MSYLQPPTPDDLPKLRQRRNLVWIELNQLDAQIEALESKQSAERQRHINEFLSKREARQSTLLDQPKGHICEKR